MPPGRAALKGMAMDLGLSTSMLGMRGVPDRLPILAAHGIPWIEIHGYGLGEFDYTDRGQVMATARMLERTGLRLWSCHSPAYRPLDITSPDEAARQATLDLMRKAVAVAADLGAPVFVCDAIRRVPRESGQRSERQALLAESLGRLLPETDRLGLRLVIENHNGWGLFETPQDFRELLATHALPGLGACWDTGHGWLAGQDAATACALGPHLVTLHLHDNDGKEDLHLIPMEGGLTWEPLVAGLRRMKYQGPFLMELGPPPEGPTDEAIERRIARAIDVYRELMIEPDVSEEGPPLREKDANRDL